MNSRIFSFVLFFLSFGLFAVASPLDVDLEARDMEKRASAVVDVIAKLSSDVNGALNSFTATADAGPNINAITNAFVTATNSLQRMGPVFLSNADKNTVAKGVADAINVAADHISKAPQTVSGITASVLLDAQIKVFLNVFGIIVVGVAGIIAKLIINIKLLLSIHLVLVANIFIDLLGIIIIL
ncbi:hypothetical protein AURDEDRAFT_116828 [Auricularia subglabra TFB-10046 SS5]|uniref:Uncharacterized protein n=1 Tax=Auricularia subglabra (strain TFB-10046 / SS5) TaxID=717982 RepID=J0DAM8_AURST|nr:hypothetical protein AURDEDRAFT_116828 [Auricularia subglabra TFB-10046 SS5]